MNLLSIHIFLVGGFYGPGGDHESNLKCSINILSMKKEEIKGEINISFLD